MVSDRNILRMALAGLFVLFAVKACKYIEREIQALSFSEPCEPVSSRVEAYRLCHLSTLKQ